MITSADLCSKLSIPPRRLYGFVEKGYVDYPKADKPRYGTRYMWNQSQVEQVLIANALDKFLTPVTIRRLTRDPYGEALPASDLFSFILYADKIEDLAYDLIERKK